MVVEAFGGPDVFELRDVPDPVVGPGQVRVGVDHCGVNFTDVRNRRGDGLGRPPMVVGIEVAGRVLEVGEGVERLQVGDAVAALCGGDGYAEQVVTDAARVVRLPADLAGDPVAACVVGVLPSALNLLRHGGRVQPGESMLFHGAAGGVGSVFAQAAKVLGLGPTIGTVGSQSKVDAAQRFGYANVVVRDGFVDSIGGLTEGRGVDVVFDPIGGAVRARSWEALADFGRLVHFGNASHEPEVVPAADALRARGLGYMGYSGGQHAVRDPQTVRSSWLEAVDLVASGRVVIEVTEVFSLADAARAHALFEGGETVGKVVLAP
ncbi:MAG: zinc-binding dehydrogenase [Acidimicrobiia bacterium]|nr:zinc-binding dehydrogenase [Acidimicrobiia bacterium]MDH4308510.1 zinc-binding dehydrogenase [Acidimicrobiia bacterium]MDH5292354.1 zinc-binding dehydrogenase [Acidimicrobiia bacterium]